MKKKTFSYIATRGETDKYSKFDDKVICFPRFWDLWHNFFTVVIYSGWMWASVWYFQSLTPYSNIYKWEKPTYIDKFG
jgi:hypothetical protein